MLLNENPFYLLEIDSLTNKQNIDEAAEDKSFDDPEHEKIYENARDSLFNPRKRIAAEISWFLGMSWNDIPKNQSELKTRNDYPNPVAVFASAMNRIPDLEVEDAVVKIPELDSLYAKLKSEQIEKIINQDRKKAGIPLLQDTAVIDEGLRSLQEDVHQAILMLTKKMKHPVYTRLVNEIAEKLTQKKISYGNILIRFFDTYNLDINKDVLAEKAEIRRILDDKNILYKASLINELEIHMRKVASMTKARCLLSNLKGIDDFGEVEEIFIYIWQKCADFFMKNNNAIVAYRVMSLVEDNFSILAKRFPNFERDFEKIKGIVSEESGKRQESHTWTNQLINHSHVYVEAESAFKEILSQIEAKGHFTDGYRQENSRFLYNDFEKSYRNIIYAFLNRTEYNSDEMIKVHEYAALIYLKIAKLYTWINGWNASREYANMAYEQVKYTNNTTLKKQVDDLKSDLTKVGTVQSVSQPKRSSRAGMEYLILGICVFIGMIKGGVGGIIVGFIIGIIIIDVISN